MRLLLLVGVLIAISVQNAQSQVRVSHTVINAGGHGSRLIAPSSLARVPLHHSYAPIRNAFRPIRPVRPFSPALHRVPSHPIYRRPYRRSTVNHHLQKRGLSVVQGVVLGAVGGAIVTKKVIKGVKKLGLLKKVHHHHHSFGRKRRSTDWFDQLAAQYEPVRQMQQVVSNVQKQLPLRSERLRFQFARFPAAFSAATGIRLPDFFVENANVKQKQQVTFDSANEASAALPARPSFVNRIHNHQSPSQSYKWTPPTTVEFVPNRVESNGNSAQSNPAADILTTNNANSPTFDPSLRPIASESDRIAYIVAENPIDTLANNAPEVSESVRKEVETNRALDPTELPLPVTTDNLHSESLPETHSSTFSNTGNESNTDSISLNNSFNSPSSDNFK